MAAPKKVVDTWKTKSWYTVVAPNFLNNVECAEVPAQDEANLMNRVIQLPLKEITRDMGHVYTSIKLRVSEIRGKKAYAKFIGHTVAREYLRTLARRRRTPIDYVMWLTSKDGVEFKAKLLIVANGKCSDSQKKALRATAAKILKTNATAMDFGEFIRGVLFNKISMELLDKLQPIFPVARVEVWRTELKEVFDVSEVMELEKSDLQKELDQKTAREKASRGGSSEQVQEPAQQKEEASESEAQASTA